MTKHEKDKRTPLSLHHVGFYYRLSGDPVGVHRAEVRSKMHELSDWFWHLTEKGDSSTNFQIVVQDVSHQLKKGIAADQIPDVDELIFIKKKLGRVDGATKSDRRALDRSAEKINELLTMMQQIPHSSTGAGSFKKK